MPISSRIKLLIDFLKTEKGIAIILVIVAIVFNAVFLWPEVSIRTFSLNDDVLHLTLVQEASNAINQGQNPTDFWFKQIGLGFPIFHYYQHLPHLVLAVVYQFTSAFLSLPKLFDISRYLLLIFFPLSIFWSMRRFGFDYLAAGFSSLVAALLSTNGLYGFDYGSYVWRGSGLYAQLWAMFFLPLALAEIYRTIRKEGLFFWPVFLSVIVFLSHLLYGYMLILSAIIFVILKPDRAEIISRLKRLAIIFLLTAAVTSYFLIPFVLDRAYLNRSIWEEVYKYDSFGTAVVLKNLFTGNLLDYGRLPILTILFFLSAILAAKFWKKESSRLVLSLSIFWILLYFGRPTWGSLLNILPFNQDFHLHRFIGGFHLGAIMLIGAGISLIWQEIKEFSFKWHIVAGILLLLLSLPAFIERVNYYQLNSQWKRESHAVLSSKNNEIYDIKKTLGSLPPGRVYAGLPADFGKAPYYQIGSVPLYDILPQLGIDSFGYAFYTFPLVTDVRLNFDNKRLEQYNLFNIRYVLLHKTWTAPSYYSKIKEMEDFVLYQIPTTGYFDLVDVPAVLYGDKSNFYSPNAKWLSSSLSKLKQNPIIEIGSQPQNTFGLPVFSFHETNEKILSDLAKSLPACGEIAKERIDKNGYWAQFTANRECYLMLKTNYHPGLVAILDNEKVIPVMLTPGFVGIRVSPGMHQVIISYKPPFSRVALFIFSIILLFVLGFYHTKIYNKKKEYLSRIKIFWSGIVNFVIKQNANRVVNFCVMILLIVMFFLAVLSLKGDSIVFDELAHIPAGYSYLTQRDYRFNLEHPPLVKDLAAVPLLFLKLNFPKDSVAWENSNEWTFGTEFLYRSGNNADQITFWARLPMVLLLVFFGWFLFRWTQELAGNKAALFVLTLFSFCPNFLANGRLVTTDVAAALGAVLTLYFWLKFLKAPSKKNMVVGGLILGLSLLFKFSLLILIPFLALITIIFAYLSTKSFGQVLKYIGFAVLAVIIGMIFIVWPVYYFHLSGYSVQKQLSDVNHYFPYNGLNTLGKTCIWMVDKPAFRPFSQFCFGVNAVIERVTLTPGWITYLDGQVSLAGFWYYFPFVYILKVPLAFHILTFIALDTAYMALRAKSFIEIKNQYKEYILDHFTEFAMVLFIVVYLVVALKSPLNIGVRHLLPIFPFIYVLVSLGIKNTLDKIKNTQYKKMTGFIILLLLSWYAVSSLSVFPHYLTYFNELADGPKNGYKYAVDSNSDWGQDLKRLSDWVDTQGINKIYIDYFGAGDLNYYLKEKYIPWYGSSWWSWKKLQNTGKFPPGNYLAVSATYLQQGRGVPVPGLKWQGGEYNWLNDYRPIAQIGNSIFVYYIY